VPHSGNRNRHKNCLSQARMRRRLWHTAERTTLAASPAAFEIRAAEVIFGLQASMMGSMAERRRNSRLMTPKTPRFWLEMKTRRGFCASWPRYPLST
jgi:hypothetical protein